MVCKSIIEVVTGKVIDVYCLNKYYHGCKLAKESNMGKNHEQTCQLNYECPSRSRKMERNTAILNFWYLKDGDSR